MASKQNPALPDKTTQNGLTNNGHAPAADRTTLDARLMAGETIPAAALLAVLKSQPPPEGDLLRRYAEQLLDQALATRDVEASILLTRLMDANPPLDDALYADLNEKLQAEPDSVYAFIRARVADGPNERWLFRLKVAALCALQVALTDGDEETAINWLKLVAREPATYGLGDMLHAGLIAAGQRARTEPGLGRLLIPLAVRRDPAALDHLLRDKALLDAMAEQNNLGRVLRDYDGDVLQTLQNHGYEMFIVATARAAQAKDSALFTPATIEQVWAGYTGAQPVSVPTQYAPETIVAAWVLDGTMWLDEAALQTILMLALRDRKDDLFLTLIRRLTGRDTYLKLLSTALQRSGRSEADVLVLLGQLQTTGELPAQAATDVYVRLLGAWDWRKSALPVIQQLARTIQHQPTVTISAEVIWHLLDIAAETKDETIVKVVSRRATADLEATEDETALIDKLPRLVTDVQWHAGTRQYVIAWWRGFVRSCPLARLQRIDKALDGKKALDDLRSILQTVISFRKMLGKRNLQQFAWDVGIAYGIFQALAESFDPSPRRAASFDMTTLRAELDSRSDELTPQEQQIMANNLKELAQLIAGMGDNRSKATIMRRGDDVDRQLMTGEQQPHSAVDALKWLAGYLSGSQEKEEADEE